MFKLKGSRALGVEASIALVLLHLIDISSNEAR